jgi:hypothetical protein
MMFKSPGLFGQRPRFSPFRVAMARFAKTEMDGESGQRKRLLNEGGGYNRD